MAWNEPGGPNKDPWGNRNKQQGPPDLDDLVRKIQDRVRGIFGGGGGSGGDGDGGFGGNAKSIAGLVILVVVALLGYSMIHVIQPAERGVVLRFGAYTATLQPGPHVRLPWPIEEVRRVDVDQIRTAEIGYRSVGQGQTSTVKSESLMLTQDENVVDVQLALQYRVKDARDYLFNVRRPDETLKAAAESAVREVVGKREMTFVITEGRAEVADRTEEVIQEILDRYESGLLVTSTNMQDARAPDAVQDAFQDAVRAREDRQRLINQAQAYANEVLPRARGEAARIVEEGQAYRAEKVARAEGDTDRFNQILGEYQRHPEVTRERLYLEGLESVLGNTGKVMVDVQGGNNMMLLPLDRMLSQRQAVAGSGAQDQQRSQQQQVEQVTSEGREQGGSGQERNNLRDRERR